MLGKRVCQYSHINPVAVSVISEEVDETPVNILVDKAELFGKAAGLGNPGCRY